MEATRLGQIVEQLREQLRYIYVCVYMCVCQLYKHGRPTVF